MNPEVGLNRRNSKVAPLFPPNRISKILTGLLLKDIEEAEQHKKIKRLKGCGFSNTEIAEMLQTTTNTVNVAVHSLKKSKSRKSRAKH